MTTPDPARAVDTTVMATTFARRNRMAAPVLEAAAAGVVALPPELASALRIAGSLERAAVEADEKANAAHFAAATALRRTIDMLAAAGPVSEPARPVLDAEQLAATTARHELILQQAASEASSRLETAFLFAVVGIGEELLAAVPAIVKEARPLAPLVMALDYANPGALAKLGVEAASAWDVLSALAARHDLAKKAALGVWQYLTVGPSGDRSDLHARRAGLHDLNLLASHPFSSGADERTVVPDDAYIARLGDFGITGPSSLLRNLGDQPGRSTSWRWAPELWAPRDHPVARLAAAALAPERSWPKPAPRPVLRRPGTAPA